MGESAQEPDLWWLPEGESSQDWLVGVGHHRPLTPDDQPSPSIPDQERPTLPGWWHSIDEQGQLSAEFQLYPPDFLHRWLSACQNTNVYCTLRLFPLAAGRQATLGPFLVDIDNGTSDLEDAQQIARRTVKLSAEEWRLTESDLRVFFSGHKGFNIEIRPEALGIAGPLERQLELSCERLDFIIRRLREGDAMPATINAVSAHGTYIDRIYRVGLGVRHPYIRLPDSVNAWIEADSVQVRRVRTRPSIEELHRLPLEAILSRAAG